MHMPGVCTSGPQIAGRRRAVTAGVPSRAVALLAVLSASIVAAAAPIDPPVDRLPVAVGASGYLRRG